MRSSNASTSSCVRLGSSFQRAAFWPTSFSIARSTSLGVAVRASNRVASDARCIAPSKHQHTACGLHGAWLFCPEASRAITPCVQVPGLESNSRAALSVICIAQRPRSITSRLSRSGAATTLSLVNTRIPTDSIATNVRKTARPSRFCAALLGCGGVAVIASGIVRRCVVGRVLAVRAARVCDDSSSASTRALRTTAIAWRCRGVAARSRSRRSAARRRIAAKSTPGSDRSLGRPMARMGM